MTSGRIGDWIRENCSTIGDGDLLLTGNIPGFTSMASQIPAGPVWYSIEDGADRECGVGNFDGVSVISRSSVISVITNGMYSESHGPINLSGNSIVSCIFQSTAFEELETPNWSSLTGTPPDHGIFGNLLLDDHPQYLLADSSRSADSGFTISNPLADAQLILNNEAGAIDDKLCYLSGGSDFAISFVDDDLLSSQIVFYIDRTNNYTQFFTDTRRNNNTHSYYGSAEDADLVHTGAAFDIINNTGVFNLKQEVTSGYLALVTNDAFDIPNTVARFGGAFATFELYRNGNLLIEGSADDEILVKNRIILGSFDSAKGILNLAGDGPGQLSGGQIRLNVAADYSGAFPAWIVESHEDNFRIYDGIAPCIDIEHSGTSGSVILYSGGVEALHTVSQGIFLNNDVDFSLKNLGGGPLYTVDTDAYLLYQRTSKYWEFVTNGAISARLDASVTPGETRLLIYDVDNATLERVTVGAPDSAGVGSGKKVLCINN